MSDISACHLEPPVVEFRRHLVLDEFTGSCKVTGTFVEIDSIKVLFEFALGSFKRHSNESFFFKLR